MQPIKLEKRAQKTERQREREKADRFDLMECDTKSEITAKNVTS